MKRILCSLFQSVTARTAGFNTADLAAMHESGTALMIMLMLTGGAPGSTAGGMKVTTIAVLFLSVIRMPHRENCNICSFSSKFLVFFNNLSYIFIFLICKF